MQTQSTKKITLECSPHQYWGAWKKTKYLQKQFAYFQVLELYFSNCQKI
jgi:hypothetical protein